MKLEAVHTLLIKGETREYCKDRAISFFKKNLLVRYDNVQVLDDTSCSAAENGFWGLLADKIDQNRCVVGNFIRELQENGFREIADLKKMEQGYESKLLHLITHMLDGFFGADTVFYNLEEGSHGLSESFEKKIRKQPGEFWLIDVRCSTIAGDDPLDQLRNFELKLEE